MELKVYQQDGSEAGHTVALDPTIFEIEPNDHVLWLDVRRIQAHGRQGTHKAKERGEVAGSTRKLYRQKGTGSARPGSARSPLRRSGGTFFGPRPRRYNLKINRKTQRLARRSALTYKARAAAIRIVEDFSMEVPNTKQIERLLDAFDVRGRSVLLLTSEGHTAIHQSGRNIPKLRVRCVNDVSTLDVLGAQVVVMQEGTLPVLTALLGNVAPAEV